MVIWIPTNGETTFQFECNVTENLMYATATSEPAIGSTVLSPTSLSGSSPFTITIPSGRSYLVIGIGTNSTDYHYPIWDKAIYSIGNPNNVSSYWKDINIKASSNNNWYVLYSKLLQEYSDDGKNVDISKAYTDTNYNLNASTKQIQTGSSGSPTRYWPVTPGDTVAFKYTNNSGKYVTNYTSSSDSVITGRYYWYVSTMVKNSVIQPMTDLHTETIDGETYYVFTVPTGMSYLAISYVYGSGSYDPKDQIVATVLYKGTGWVK